MRVIFWYIDFVGKTDDADFNNIISLFDHNKLSKFLETIDLDLLSYGFSDSDITKKFSNEKNAHKLISKIQSQEGFHQAVKKDPKLDKSIFPGGSTYQKVFTKKTKLVVIVPMANPGCGKTYFKEELGNQMSALGLSMNSVSSDAVQGVLREHKKKSNPNKKYTDDMLHKDTRPMYKVFWQLALHKALINSTDSPIVSNFLFIDKNHLPSSVKFSLNDLSMPLQILKDCFFVDAEMKKVVVAPKTYKTHSVDENDVLENFPFS